jgi:Ca2+-binding RTX toxin-like protein
MTILNGTPLPDSLFGGAADDELSGLGGNDTLVGFGGADVLRGGFGNDMLAAYDFGKTDDGARDTLLGNAGNDFLQVGTFDVADGGAGNDTVLATGTPTVVNGGAGRDTLQLGGDIPGDISNARVRGFERLEGSSRDSVSKLAASQFDAFSEIGAAPGKIAVHFQISGQGSSVLHFDPVLVRAYIIGGHSTESLTVAPGTRTALIYTGGWADALVVGGDGNDQLSGGVGNDTLRGGAGNDIIEDSSDNNADVLFGASGNDVLTSGSRDTVHGGTGNDTLNTFYWSSLHGDAGDDLFVVNRTSAEIDGGAGNDTASYAGTYGLTGVSVDLSLTGPQPSEGEVITGIENLIGSNFGDTLTGDGGDNVIEGGRGHDSLTGGGGQDTASYRGTSGDVAVDLRITGGQNTGGAGVDTLDGFANLIGGAGNDALTGGVGRNVIEGGAGNDIIDGRIGVDLADYSHAARAVQVSLALTTAQNTRGAGTDTLISMEDLRGSAFADGLAGSAAQNRIDGGAGDDTLVGAANNDTLTGGLGADRLRGGTGFDTFDFNATSESTARAPDLILDFIGAGASWGDLIDLADIDADTTVAGNQAFSLGLRGAGGLTLVNVGSDTLVRGNTDADAAFEIAILLRDGGRPASGYAEHDFLL